MDLDLTTVRAKLARSQEHAQSLKHEIAAWIERHPYSLTTQANTELTRYSIYLQVVEAPPVLRWKLMLADSLHNLRHALDHLVYAVAVADGGQKPPPKEKSLQFPIEDSASDFNQAVVCRKRLGDIRAEVVAVFESAQPYRNPHPALPPLLSILRDLTNRDKHRLLPVANAAIAQGDIGFATMDGSAIVGNWKKFTESSEVNDGTEIFAMQCDRPAPGMHFDRTNFLVAVSVWHGKRDASGPEGSDRSDALGLVEEIAGEVRRVVNLFGRR